MLEFVLLYFGGIFNMVVGTLVLFLSVAIIADYIDSKIKLKLLREQLLVCQRELYFTRKQMDESV
jgi:hypothetical protein